MRNITCFVCGKNSHMTKDCHFRKSKDGVQPKKNVVNVIIGDASTGGYGNSPVIFQPVNPLIGGLILELMFTYVLIFPYFLLIRQPGLPPS